jgi:hypothetical protein
MHWQENVSNASRSYYLQNSNSSYLVMYLGMAIGQGTTTTPDTVAIDNPTMLYGSSQASFDTSWKSFEFNYFASGSGDSHGYRLIGWNIPQSAITANGGFGYPIICSSGQTAEDRYGHGLMIFQDNNTTMDTMDNRITSGMLLNAPSSQSITATKDSAQVGLWTVRGTSVQDSISSTTNPALFYFENLPKNASAIIAFCFTSTIFDDRQDKGDMSLKALQGLGTTGGLNSLGAEFRFDNSPDYGDIQIIKGIDLEKNKNVELQSTDPVNGANHEFMTLLII